MVLSSPSLAVALMTTAAMVGQQQQRSVRQIVETKREYPSSLDNSSYTADEPLGAVADGVGGIIIADSGNHVIRRVLANGNIVTIAGVGFLPGYSGDGGPATEAMLNAPSTAVPDGTGGIIIADTNNHVIRRVFANGTIITVAALGPPSGYTGDGGPATAAKLNNPRNAANNGDGGMLVADSGNHVIRRVFANGNIVTIAGVGLVSGYSGDGGPATAAKLNYPSTAIPDGIGGILIADTYNHAIRRVFSNGTIITIAGIGLVSGYNGDGRRGAATKLNSPRSIALDGNGGILVADTNNHAIRLLSPAETCMQHFDLMSCVLTPQAQLACTFRRLVLPSIPLLVLVNSSPCTQGASQTNEAHSTTVVYCVIRDALEASAAGERPLLSMPFNIYWATQTEQQSDVIAVDMTVTMVSAVQTTAEVLGGAVCSFLVRSNSNVTAFLVGRTIAMWSSERPEVAIPCSDAIVQFINATTAVLTCNLAFWSEIWTTQDAILHFDAVLSNLVVPISLRLAFSMSTAHIEPPQLAMIPAEMRKFQSASEVVVVLHPNVISNLTAVASAPPPGCTCQGTSSTLRGWISTVAVQSCRWLDSSSIACTLPANLSASDLQVNSFLTRFTVELCCMLNVTSDGKPAVADENSLISSGLIVWDPSPWFAASGYIRQISGSIPAARDMSVPVPPTLVASLAQVVTRAWIDGLPCGSISWQLDQAMLMCNNIDWHWLGEVEQQTNGVIPLPIELELRGERMLVDVLRWALLPRVVSITSHHLQPGNCLGIYGNWLAGDDAAVTRVYIGDTSRECTVVGEPTPASLGCCISHDNFPPSLPGYPLLRIIVATSRGSSLDNVTVAVPADVSATFVETVSAIAFPSTSQTFVNATTEFRVKPCPAVRTSGANWAVCTLDIANSVCPSSSNSLVRLIGETSGTAHLSAVAPSGQIVFTSVGVVAPLGCILNVTATCTDSRGRVAATADFFHIAVVGMELSWKTGTPATVIAPPGTDLPLLAAVITPDSAMAQAISEAVNSLLNLINCTIHVLAGDVGASLQPVSSRTLSESPCALAIIAGNNLHIDVTCASVRQPASLIRDMSHTMELHCTYFPTRQILSTTELMLDVPPVVIDLRYLSDGVTNWMRSADNPVVVTAYHPLTFAMNVSFGNITSCDATSSLECVSWTFRGSNGVCQLKLAASSTPALKLSAASALNEYILSADGLNDWQKLHTVIEGPPYATGSLRAECIIWGSHAIISPAISFVVSAFVTEFEDITTPSVALPSEAGDEAFPIEPPIALNTNVYTSVVCSLAIDTGTSWCPHPGFMQYGLGFMPTWRLPRLTGLPSISVNNIPPNVSSIRMKFHDVGVWAAGGCVLALTATCRDAANRVNFTERRQLVKVTQLHGLWDLDNNLHGGRLHMVVAPAELPPLEFTLSTDLSTGNITTYVAARDMWACDVLLLATDLMPPPIESFRRMARNALSVGQVSLVAFNATAWRMRAWSVDANKVQMGGHATLRAECVWTPTGERIRMAPISVLIPMVDLRLVSKHNSSLQMDELTGLSGVPYSIAFRVSARVNATHPDVDVNDTAISVDIPSVSCSWDVANRSNVAVALGAASQEEFGAFTLQPGETNAHIGMLESFQVTGPPFSTLTAALQCSMWHYSIRSQPVRFSTAGMAVEPLAPLPLQFIPSDAGALWLIPQPIRVGLRVINDTLLTNDEAQCSLRVIEDDHSAISTMSSQLIFKDAQSALTAYTGIHADEAGVVVFPPFGIRAQYDRAAVTMEVSCSRYSEGPVTLTWSLGLIPLSYRSCSAPYLESTTSAPFSLHATLGPSCEAPPAAAKHGLPTISCSIRSNSDIAVVQNGHAVANATTGRIVFRALAVIAPPGRTYGLTLMCFAASVAIPPVNGVVTYVNITGCPPGTRSQNSFCQPCDPLYYSLGGAQEECIPCPSHGASCVNGRLQLQDNFYRPQRFWGAPIDASSELYPCFNGEACTSNTSTGMHGCRNGYTGPLCGVCDASNNYVRTGFACHPCGDQGTQQALVACVMLLIFAVLTYTVLRTQRSEVSGASIVLKIAISYLQVVGSLRMLKAGGTQAYQDIMGWTDGLSANPLGTRLLQCAWKPTYLAQYLVTISLPLLSSAAVVVIILLAAALQHVPVRTWTQKMLRKPPGGSTASPAPCFRGRECLTTVQSCIGERKHISTLLFVIFLFYMSITSASLQALDCYDQAIDGVTYLRADLSVRCHDAHHTIAKVFSFLTLIFLTFGFPLLVFWRMTSGTEAAKVDAHSHSTWGFLYDGYRESGAIIEGTEPASKAFTPGHATVVRRLQKSCLRRGRESLAWWEALVLLRKAGIALIAALITDAHIQSGIASIWLTMFLYLHLHVQPYARPIFNRLETLSLGATVATATISAMLLRHDVTGPVFQASQSSDRVAADGSITVALAFINVSTTAVFGCLWLGIQLRPCTLVTWRLPLRYSFLLSRSPPTEHQEPTLVEHRNPTCNGKAMHNPLHPVPYNTLIGAKPPVTNPLHRVIGGTDQHSPDLRGKGSVAGDNSRSINLILRQKLNASTGRSRSPKDGAIKRMAAGVMPDSTTNQSDCANGNNSLGATKPLGVEVTVTGHKRESNSLHTSVDIATVNGPSITSTIEKTNGNNSTAPSTSMGAEGRVILGKQRFQAEAVGTESARSARTNPESAGVNTP